MSGSNAAIAAIIPVAVLLLSGWLLAVYHANSHPRWGNQPSADSFAPQALEGTVPAQRLSSPGPVVPGQRVGAADELTPDQAQVGDQELR
jgi:hypothetical protein